MKLLSSAAEINASSLFVGKFAIFTPIFCQPYQNSKS